MKKTSIIRFMCFVLALTMMAVGCGKENPGDKTSESTTASSQAAETIQFPLKEKITIEFLTPEHPSGGSYPEAPEHLGYQWLEEQTNIHMKLIQVPWENAKEKYTAMMASNSLPDLIDLCWTGVENWQEQDIYNYGKDGVFADIMQYKDLVPDYLKLIDKMPYLKDRIWDGSMYMFWDSDPDVYTNMGGTFLYRKDLFDKYNLKEPETWDELYQSLKVLKEKDPKSYPMASFGEGLQNNVFFYGANTFKAPVKVYYDQEEKGFTYGPLKDSYKTFLAFYKKLYEEKILNPDFSVMTYEQWSQSWINGTSQVGFWKGYSGEKFEADNASNNTKNSKEQGKDGGDWVVGMRVPATEKGGSRGWISEAPPIKAWPGRVINAKSKYVKELMAMMNVLAKRDTKVYMEYGDPKYGVWEVVNGQYKFKDTKIKSPYNPAGTEDWKTYRNNRWGNWMVLKTSILVYNDSVIDFEMQDAFKDPFWTYLFAMMDNYRKDGGIQASLQQPIVIFSAEDKQKVVLLQDTIDNLVLENSLNIITGKKPLEEWDNVVKQLNDNGVQDLIKLYQGSVRK